MIFFLTWYVQRLHELEMEFYPILSFPSLHTLPYKFAVPSCRGRVQFPAPWHCVPNHMTFLGPMACKKTWCKQKLEMCHLGWTCSLALLSSYCNEKNVAQWTSWSKEDERGKGRLGPYLLCEVEPSRDQRRSAHPPRAHRISKNKRFLFQATVFWGNLNTALLGYVNRRVLYRHFCIHSINQLTPLTIIWGRFYYLPFRWGNRCREVKQFSQSNIARKQKSRNLFPIGKLNSPINKSMHFPTGLFSVTKNQFQLHCISIQAPWMYFALIDLMGLSWHYTKEIKNMGSEIRLSTSPGLWFTIYMTSGRVI